MVLLLVVDLDPELAALRPLGAFFVLRTIGDPAETSRPALPTLAQVYENASSDVYGNPLTFRIRKVADALDAPEPRIAASIAHLGLAARLWSAALGCAAVYGRIPDLSPGRLHWDPDGSAPEDLWLAPREPGESLQGDARTLADVVLHGHLEPLAAALRTAYRPASGLLWGNAASALVGAVRQLGPHGAGARARALAAELLAHPLLEGALDPRTLRRRSCCLYYRLPGGGVCGDCCFTRAPRSSPRGTSG
ncbi:(2Fe-2S)-binding protein [Streptomyces griseorubiginosus]|uniref:Ferric iron reductase n=1 Tax=Streptomyces griseorubiginosus TaxID=67304 RepID=A0A101S6C8_9ACTN|nr:(2Fe-2S)-binding protein [Streptomyces griseorubiginosus]KUN67982.1 ferric iron reductase [Streptomyces griseorubiginosus]